MSTVKLKRLQTHDGLVDLQVKLIPLQAIATIRRDCPQVLEPSEAETFEEQQWQDVNALIEEIKQLNQ